MLWTIKVWNMMRPLGERNKCSLPLFIHLYKTFHIYSYLSIKLKSTHDLRGHIKFSSLIPSFVTLYFVWLLLINMYGFPSIMTQIIYLIQKVMTLQPSFIQEQKQLSIPMRHGQISGLLIFEYVLVQFLSLNLRNYLIIK